MHLSLRHGLACVVLSVCAIFFGALPRPAQAAIGTADVVPSATLLFPYFEVDLGSATGTDTVLSVQNTSATAILAHVTVWSDEGIPAAIFDTYLTGYDLVSFSMRDVLNGNLPRTASAGQDPTDTISPKGFSSQDINFASCNGQLPYAAGTIPSPVGMTPSDLKLALTGQATASISAGKCWGRPTGDNHARGYVTVDTVNQCTGFGPADSSASYFGINFSGIATFQNVMHGTYFIADTAQNFVLADAAVHIEAGYPGSDPNSALVTTSGNYTFYGRYDMTAWDASDSREPLPTVWGVQGETGTSSLIVWRDSKTSEVPHTCGSNPAYYPLGQEGMAYFGTDSQITVPYVPGIPVPAATQLAPFNAATFNTPASKLGFLFVNLNTSVTPAGANPPADPAEAQSYIVVSRQHLGALPTASGHAAVSISGANGSIHYTPGN